MHYKGSFSSDNKIVITDLRYDKEAELLKKYNSYIIKIVRPEVVSEPIELSERYIDSVIINDSDLDAPAVRHSESALHSKVFYTVY